MGMIRLEDLKLGMQLSEELLSSNGRFLLPKGTVLEEKHLRILKIWGVTEAEVSGVSQEEADEATQSEFDPAMVARAEEIADQVFQFAPVEHEAMAELRRVCAKRVLDTLTTGALSDPGDDLQNSVGHPGGLVAPENLDDEDETAPESPEDLVTQEVQLASFPDIYFQIMDVLNNPRSSATHAADVVSKDTSLAAKLLRLVNSPFYGFPSKVDSITRAVTLVGANELSMLALGVSVVHYFGDIPSNIIDMKSFWKHSIACGVFARILAGHKPGLSEERFFLGGLIHDIGRLIVLKNYRTTAARSFTIAHDEPCSLADAETKVMGFDHAMVGGLLLKDWKFPPALEEIVRYHHSPMEAQNPMEASIVHIADIFARAMSSGQHGLFYVPSLQGEAWDSLDLAPSLISQIVSQAEHMIHDIYNSFLGEE